MKKYVEMVMENIKDMTEVKIPALVKNGLSYDEYMQQRAALNTCIVSAIYGAEMKPSKKGGCKVRFNHSLPSFFQVREICRMLSDYIENVENPYLQAAVQDPDDVVQCNMAIIPQVQKLKTKEVKDFMVGGNSVLKAFICEGDVLSMAAMAEDVHHRINRNKAIIFGSAAAVVAAGLIGYKIYKNKKDDAILVDVDEPDVEVDVDDDIDNPADVELDDAPADVEI